MRGKKRKPKFLLDPKAEGFGGIPFSSIVVFILFIVSFFLRVV